MRTIDETIEYYKDKVRINKEYAHECEICANQKISKILKLDKIHNRDRAACLEEAKNCQQIVDWLQELKNLRERM